jgi:hypothetical protein
MEKKTKNYLEKSEILKNSIKGLFEVVLVVDTTCLTAGNILAIVNEKTSLKTSYYVLANVLKEYPGCFRKELRSMPNTTPRVYYNLKLLK